MITINCIYLATYYSFPIQIWQLTIWSDFIIVELLNLYQPQIYFYKYDKVQRFHKSKLTYKNRKLLDSIKNCFAF